MDVRVTFCPLVVRRRHRRGIGFINISKSASSHACWGCTIKTISASNAQLTPPATKKSKFTFTQRACTLSSTSQKACMGTLKFVCVNKIRSDRWVDGLPLEYDNHYERDCKTQHDGSHDEQNDPELGNRKDPAIERKTRYETASANQTRSPFVGQSYMESLLKQMVSPKKSSKTQRVWRNIDVASRGSIHMCLPNPRGIAILCVRWVGSGNES